MMGANLGPDILMAIFYVGIIIGGIIGLYNLFLDKNPRFFKYIAIIISYIILWIIAIKTGSTLLIYLCAFLFIFFFIFLGHLAFGGD